MRKKKKSAYLLWALMGILVAVGVWMVLGK